MKCLNYEEPHMEAFLSMLSSLEKAIYRSHQMLTIRGKRGRPVPVLIPIDIQQLLQIVANKETRSSVGVGSSPYLFANFGEQSSNIAIFCFLF